MLGLTARQAQILDLIKDALQSSGMPPTRAEIARFFGFKSPNAVEEHLKALARKGAIEMLPGIARGIRLPEALGLPLVGRVSAGRPILAAEDILGHHPINPSLFKPHADFLLKVQGQSMREVGIIDGDWLAVHRTSTAEHGQIIVARIDDEVTVKRLHSERGKIRLLAENPDYAPIEIDPARQSFCIEGRYVGLIRPTA